MTVGQPQQRIEDPELLTGRALFVDDLPQARHALHLALVRSPFAHAEFSVSPSDGVFDHNRIPDLSWDHLLPGLPRRQPLAVGRVRHIGEPVAFLLDSEPRAANHRVEMVDVEYHPLPATVDLADALSPDAPLVYEELETNVVYNDESEHHDDLFAGSDRVIERVFRNHRMAPAMLECRAILAVPDGSGVTVHVGHQNPHKLRDELAGILGIDSSLVRVVVPNVGGAFGAKASLYPEYVLAAWAALHDGEPVKYIETRTENLVLTAHGRSQLQKVTAGVANDGILRALHVEIDAEFGAAVDLQRWCVALTRHMLSGAYRIPRIEWKIRGHLTHTPPVGAFRGAGRPEAAYLIERTIDEVAREHGLDPRVVRERNFLDPADFPYRSPTGATYDSGSYLTAFSQALSRSGYHGNQQPSSWTDEHGRLCGRGVASYVELSASGQEYGSVKLGSDGTAVVKTGSSPHGQGHETTWAQLVAAKLGVGLDRVRVLHSDTASIPRGGGTSGSRSTALAGSAAFRAAEEVEATLKELAAESLEASAADILLVDGRAVVAGTDVGVAISELVARAGGAVSAEHVFEASGQNFPFGTHVCTVAIDAGTGEVEITEYTAVDDAGKIVNPLIAEGQLHGGTLQGISHALAEEVRFDEVGQMIGGSFAGYPLPSIREAPRVDLGRTLTPSPTNPLGAKGIGESGVTGATPAVANAVYNALAPLGIGEDTLTMPFTPVKVWTALAGAMRS